MIFFIIAIVAVIFLGPYFQKWALSRIKVGDKKDE